MSSPLSDYRYEISSPARSVSRGAPTLIVLCACCTTVLALAAVAYCVGRSTRTETRFLEPGRAPTYDEAYIACPISYALDSSDANDVVFIGDSVCQYDIDPARLKSLCGLSVYNLGGRSYFGPLGYWLTAKAYLLHHPKPKLFVLCLCAVSLHADPAFMNGTVPRRFTEAYGPEVGAVPVQQSCVPFVRYGARSMGTLINSQTSVVDLPLDGQRETFRTLQDRLVASRGFVALVGDHGELKPVQEIAPEDQLVREEWNDGVRKLAAECHSVGVPLLIQFCPLSKDFEHAANYSPIETWGRDMTASCPGTRVVRPTLVWYDQSLSWDRVHLNAAGVAKFMQVVAKEIQETLKQAMSPLSRS